MNWTDGQKLKYQTRTSDCLSPGTAGFPPAGRPARGPRPTGSCWWRPARPAGPCTPGGRGQTRAWSHCAAARWWWAEIHCSRKQYGGRKFVLRRNLLGYLTTSSTMCVFKSLPTCRSRRRPARLLTSCSRRSRFSSWVSRPSSIYRSLSCRDLRSSVAGSPPPEACGTRNKPEPVKEQLTMTVNRLDRVWTSNKLLMSHLSSSSVTF